MNSKMTNKLEIAKRVRKLRIDNRYTQENIAEHLNISVYAYRKKEKGLINISVDELVALHNIYNVSFEYIILGEKIKRDIVWEEICCTNDAAKLNLLLRLAGYFAGTDDMDEVLYKIRIDKQDK